MREANCSTLSFDEGATRTNERGKRRISPGRHCTHNTKRVALTPRGKYKWVGGGAGGWGVRGLAEEKGERVGWGVGGYGEGGRRGGRGVYRDPLQVIVGKW